MTTPDDIGPERLAEIVDGAGPRNDEERALLALMDETRALAPGASDDLRRRVLEGPPSQAAAGWRTRRRRLGAGLGRRRLLVGAPVIAGVVALAIAIPALNDGGGTASPPTTADSIAAIEAAPPAPQAEDVAGADVERSGAPARLAKPARASALSGANSGAATVATAPPAVTDPDRAQQVTATTRVQVDGVTTLSRASNRAMSAIRSLGGFTATSDYSVPNGAEGTNHLVFRVPVDRAGDALAAFGRLGVVTGQSANIVDLTTRLDTETLRIERLQAQVAELTAQLAARPGDEQLAREIARAQASLRRVDQARAETLARTRLATLRLTLTTEGPPAPIAEEGRFAGPISRAGGRLADGTAWALGAIVLVGPFVLLAAVAGWGVLRARGRSTRRLMGAA